jgi:CDP-glucose 4,6-dehydratase
MEIMVTQSQLLSYFNNKRVFITGHTGFKGSWLMAILNLAGARIKGYALAPCYDQGLFQLLEPLNVANSVIADITDKNRLEKELLAFEPEFIFHMAAQPLVRKSYEIPAETFDVNVAGTANLLEATMRLPSKCSIVVITTDKVYENKEQDILYKETDQLGGYDPYSASKACAELVVSAFRNSFFNYNNYISHKKAIASARAGNVIGGGDWNRDRIFPDIIRSLEENSPVGVRNPDAIRPWQHVLEPLSGYLQLARLLDAEPGTYSKPYNFGPLPFDHLPVKQLVDEAISSWGGGNWKDLSSADQPHEAGMLKLDISHAMNELKWSPKLSAKEAIAWTIDWYRQPVHERTDYTFRQIKDYFAL